MDNDQNGGSQESKQVQESPTPQGKESPIALEKKQLQNSGEIRVENQVSEGERLEKNSSKNKIVPIQVVEDAPAEKGNENIEKTQPKETSQPLKNTTQTENKDAYEKIELEEKTKENEKPVGKCQNMSSYVLNHEFMDLEVHDKGSGNIKCMCNLQWCVRIIWFLLLLVTIGGAFYYPIMMETSSGNVKKIRTFTSPNAVSKKELTLKEFGIQQFIVLKDKKEVVYEKIKSTWYWPTFLEMNKEYECNKIKETVPTVVCPTQPSRRILLGFVGGVDNVQATADENADKTSDSVKETAKLTPKGNIEVTGGGAMVNSIGGAKSVVVDNAPKVDPTVQSLAAQQEKEVKKIKENEDKKAAATVIGSVATMDENALVNDAKTSDDAKKVAETTIEVREEEKKEEEKPPVYKYPELTDKIAHNYLCHSLFMVIREEISDTNSVVFTPECQVAEASDGTLIIHNNFQQAQSRINYDGIGSWDFKSVSDGKVTGQKNFIFENNENKMHSLVIINDPTQNLYNSETKSGVVISRQYIVSSNQDPPPKDEIHTKYIEYIENSEGLFKILMSQEVGKQVPTQEQLDLHFFKNLTKGEGSESGVYAHEIGMRLHLESIDETNAMKKQQIELPLTFDFRERVSEIEYFTFEDYLMDVGSFLQLFVFVLYVLFSPVGFLFVYFFIKAIIRLIMRKYKEAAQLNSIEKQLKKFELINEALHEKKDEPEFKEIYRDVQYYIDLDQSSMTFDQIEELHHKMKKLDKKLPDIADLESMISTVRFQQPLAQKIMDEQVESVVNDRSDFTLSQVSELVRKRLSLVSIYQMYDDIQLELEKMNSELHIQSEKLQFLFNTIAERAERRKSKRSPSKV